jgi:hypothetical protein
MRITRSRAKHGNVLPIAMGAIAQIPEAALHHVAHHRRHPSSLYGRSLANVAAKWHLALDANDKFALSFVWAQDDTPMPAALAAYRELLFALYEHLDASYGVVRSLVSVTGTKDALMYSQFLDRNKIPGWSDFRSRVRSYTQNRLGSVVNSLKHNASEMASVYLHSGSDVRAGYYIRDVQSTGALGPSIRVHADGNSGFTFARDMLLHYWNLYFVSSELGKLIHKLAPQPDAPVYENDSLGSSFEALAERMSALPLAFFPDEARMPCPIVRWNQRDRELQLDFPSPVRPRRLPNSSQIRSSLVIDGNHPTNKLPYYGKSAA